MLPYGMVEVREYLCVDGRSPYGVWFDGLNAPAAAKVAIALIRMGQGNLSNAKGGGTKKRQHKDIEKAHDLWRDYKKRKRET